MLIGMVHRRESGAALCLFLGTPALSGQVEGLTKALEKLPPGVLQEVLEDLGVSTIPAPVPETGSTYIDAAPGDDGELLMGVTWPDPRFTINGNTVTDNLTGLVWTKDAYYFGDTMIWIDACTACDGLNLDGIDDWRLPNVRELLSLIDYGSSDPALPESHPFINVQPSTYWSSTSLDHNHDWAWNVDIQVGLVDYSTQSKNNENELRNVWCVRGGQ